MQELCLVPGKQNATSFPDEVLKHIYCFQETPDEISHLVSSEVLWNRAYQSHQCLTLASIFHKKNETVTRLNAKCRNLSTNLQQSFDVTDHKKQALSRTDVWESKRAPRSESCPSKEITFLFPVLIGVHQHLLKN